MPKFIDDLSVNSADYFEFGLSRRHFGYW